jgi:hypothetical protein
MDFTDAYTSLLLSIILMVFKLYAAMATLVLVALFPITKSIVKKRFLSFGVEIDGSKPWDVKVHNEKRFYTRVAIEGTFGLLEGRLDKDWSTENCTELIRRLFQSRRQQEVQHPLTWTLKYFNLQTKARAWQVGAIHYDVGEQKNSAATCTYNTHI